MKQSLSIWNHVRKTYDDGNLLDEEYANWKSLYPDYIETDSQPGYEDEPIIEKRIEELSSVLNSDKNSDNQSEKSLKRPRKTRL